MAKRLWNYFDGEPFLTNPHLAVYSLNPRKRKAGSRMAIRRRRVARRNAPRVRHVRRNAPKRRRRSLRNPYPLAGLVVNPRRRRHRRNPVVRHGRRHHYRRNPAVLGVQLPDIKSIAFAGVGYIGTQSLYSVITTSGMIPASMAPTSAPMRYLYYAGIGLGLTAAVKAFSGTSDAQYTALGSALFIVKQIILDNFPNTIPGLSGYTAGTTPGMAGYVMGNQPTMKQLSGMRGMGMAVSNFPGSVGSSNPIPTRFNRF